jgi:hypothetical protein
VFDPEYSGLRWKEDKGIHHVEEPASPAKTMNEELDIRRVKPHGRRYARCMQLCFILKASETNLHHG